jgi:cyanate permease
MIGALSGTLIGYMFDATGNYNVVLWTMAVVQALVIVCVIAAYRRKAAAEAA